MDNSIGLLKAGVMTESVGLSIGATNLAAVTVGRAAVTRPAVLMRERGAVLTDFVDRVGDPVEIVAPDGSTHRAEAVLGEALRAMLGTVPRGTHTGISHPAHWHPRQVDAIRAALAADPELGSAAIVSDAVTALAALAENPGLPARGVIALCDFGGTGTSVTIADTANGYQPIAPTVRHPDFSGALIDQMLLTQVLAGVPGAVDGSGTSAIGSLTRLRSLCRTAKEQLSAAASAAVAVDLPGHRTDVRITRDELDAALRGPLADFLAVLQDTLQRSGIRPADVVAVASVGGGARIPAVTTALSEHLRVPVVTMPQPELAAAIGAGIRAARATLDDGATTVSPLPPPVPVPVPVGDPAMSSTFRALAWSQDTDEVPGVEPFVVDNPLDSATSGRFAHPERPELHFTDHEEPEAEPVPWYRRPALLLGAGAAVVIAVCATAAVIVLRSDQSSEPAPQTTTATATANPAPPAEVPQQPSPAQAPAPATEAPQQTRTVTERAPVTQAPAPVPPPSTEPPAPSPEQTSEAPPPAPAPEPTSEAPPTTQQPFIPAIPTIPPIPTIPGLPPFIPQPGQQLPH